MVAAVSDSVEALVGQIVDEFTQRLDHGEQPDVEEYACRYPEHAVVIRQVLGTLKLIRDASASPAPVDDASDIKPVHESAAGQLGDFRILREIGRGGMGVVYEAEQMSLSRRVALKVLPYAAMWDERQLQRFKNEARAAAALHHPNIVPVHAIGCERDVHFYAMQYIEGETLDRVIAKLGQSEESAATNRRLASPPQDGSCPTRSERNTTKLSQDVTATYSATNEDRPAALAAAPHGGAAAESVGGDAVSSSPSLVTRHSSPAPALQAAFFTQRSACSTAYFRTVADVGIQVAEALHHAHEQGVIHRDIKPSNLILDPRGRVWITDFGLARIETSGTLTMTGDLIGTLRYMNRAGPITKAPSR
jgi:serine/threonine protein kinase